MEETDENLFAVSLCTFVVGIEFGTTPGGLKLNGIGWLTLDKDAG